MTKNTGVVVERPVNDRSVGAMLRNSSNGDLRSTTLTGGAKGKTSLGGIWRPKSIRADKFCISSTRSPAEDFSRNQDEDLQFAVEKEQAFHADEMMDGHEKNTSDTPKKKKDKMLLLSDDFVTTPPPVSPPNSGVRKNNDDSMWKKRNQNLVGGVGGEVDKKRKNSFEKMLSLSRAFLGCTSTSNSTKNASSPQSTPTTTTSAQSVRSLERWHASDEHDEEVDVHSNESTSGSERPPMMCTDDGNAAEKECNSQHTCQIVCHSKSDLKAAAAAAADDVSSRRRQEDCMKGDEYFNTSFYSCKEEEDTRVEEKKSEVSTNSDVDGVLGADFEMSEESSHEEGLESGSRDEDEDNKEVKEDGGDESEEEKYACGTICRPSIPARDNPKESGSWIAGNTFQSTISPDGGLESVPADKKALIFFDWDDTLLPTTFLRDFCTPDDFEAILRGHWKAEFVERFSRQQWSETMKCYTKRVKKCLETCSIGATIVIVTLSKQLWVEKSAEVFMPELLPILSQTKIVYAREQWKRTSQEMGKKLITPCSAAYRGNESDISFFVNLKMKAFESVIKEEYIRKSLPKNSWETVLSIGDSMIECLACKEVTTDLESVALCTTIKFMNAPNLQELWIQVDIVERNIKQIVSGESNANLMTTLHDFEGGLIAHRGIEYTGGWRLQ